MVREMLRLMHAVPYEMQNVLPIVLSVIYFSKFSTVHTVDTFIWFFLGNTLWLVKILQIVRIVS